MIRGLLVSAAVFLALAFLGGALTDADTLEATNRGWLAVCLVAGGLAGFAGNRVARASRRARYAAAVLGPAALALAFAATTSAAEPAGPWIALAVTVAAAALGAFTRERVAAAAR
ncbi:MAG TPA: hypothetical protein VNS09_12950 [Solirubrobacter sp.]|nr:hypothetical protein [Solirubrobacter sp.]